MNSENLNCFDHFEAADAQSHAVLGDYTEPSLSDLLADPITIALAASDGLLPSDMEKFVENIKVMLRDKLKPVRV